MVLWGIVELGISTVGAYNILKGIYNMYKDAEDIKDQYRQNQDITEQYRRVQQAIDPLTESQYNRFEGEFLILNKSCILDPYKEKEVVDTTTTKDTKSQKQTHVVSSDLTTSVKIPKNNSYFF